MELTLTFPTEIWVGNTTDIDNERLSEIILEREQSEPSNNLSNVGGWQSSDDLNKDESFSNVVRYVFDCCQPIFEKSQYKDGLKIFISNMWCNVNRQRDFNKNHLHGLCDWSFAYYVSVPKDSGNIVFCDPRVRRQMANQDRFLKNYSNNFQHGEYSTSPSEGSIVVFPSYLEHYVQPNQSELPRISISGNITIRE
tara:strand:+ start:285 stop:872 length:588 start_codon:yes stop_codon:yes gene_type:complete